MKKNQIGDTLVEVLIAITVLGIVVAGSLAIMNHSMISIMNSTERAATRAEINTQINLINYVFRNSQTTTKDTWNAIMNLAFIGKAGGGLPTSSTNPYNSDTCGINTNGDPTNTTNGWGSFYLEPQYNSDNSVSNVMLTVATSDDNSPNATGRAITGQGLWVDAVYYKQQNTAPMNARPYIDFYIKACWTPLGNNPKSQSLTVARVYVYNESTPVPVSIPVVDTASKPTCGPPSGQNYTDTYKAQWNGYYRLEVWGGQGGQSADNPGGGLGGYSKGYIYLSKNQQLYVYAGCQGGNRNGGYDGKGGGFNGGGDVGLGNGASGFSDGWGGGGGSDIRTVGGQWNNSASLNSRIIVAGGGGGVGGAGSNHGGAGGVGGGASGGNGELSSSPNTGDKGGIGGNQTCVTSSDDPDTPVRGVGKGGDASSKGGGGGGGGSGFINGSVNGKSLENAETKAGVRAGNGLVVITYVGSGIPL